MSAFRAIPAASLLLTRRPVTSDKICNIKTQRDSRVGLGGSCARARGCASARDACRERDARESGEGRENRDGRESRGMAEIEPGYGFDNARATASARELL